MDIVKEAHSYAGLPREIKLYIAILDTNIIHLCCPVYRVRVNPIRSFDICHNSCT